MSMTALMVERNYGVSNERRDMERIKMEYEGKVCKSLEIDILVVGEGSKSTKMCVSEKEKESERGGRGLL